jgi:hypothetical protein
MGLDIIAYSNLAPIGKHVEELWCPDDDHIQAFAYDVFPQSFRGIPVLSTRGEFVDGGCYERTDKTETLDFRAGSYGGYGQWREDLQRQFNPQREVNGPFYELIWFADNEGSIGPEAAADLLVDFREHADRYDPSGAYPDYSREKYRDWTRACQLAADSGLIYFC